MRWIIAALIVLGLSPAFAQEASEKVAHTRASFKLDNLAIDVLATDRPGEVQLTINKDEATAKFEVPKLQGTITRLSACAWNSNRGVAVAIETKSGDARRWSYHWMTIDINKVEGKVHLKRIGVGSEAFLSDLPHEHALSVTNPRSDTIRILLTRKDPMPQEAIGFLYVHDCPVGPFSSKGSAYAKLYELRAREIEKGR